MASDKIVPPEALRAKLAAAGFDVGEIMMLGKDLGIDLIAVLAGWTPVLLRLYAEPPRRRWWQFWRAA